MSNITENNKELQSLSDAIRILKASKHYSDLFDSFSCKRKLKVDNNKTEISEAIFYHVCKMQLAGWRHKDKFNRKRKHPLSEFFQDIIAFYLKALLPFDYSVELEAKKGKMQTDIAIKKGDDYKFLIEVKTTIGWARPDGKSNDQYKEFKAKFMERIAALSYNFNVREENIIYIFEEPSNVRSDFLKYFWEEGKIVERPKIEPFSKIFPLFLPNTADPEYWNKKEFSKEKNYQEITDGKIMEKAKKSILTPFERIIQMIIKPSDSA